VSIPPSTPAAATSSGSPPGSAATGLALEHCFLVYLGDNQLLGTFLEASGLAVEYEMYEYAEGGNNLYTHHLKGRLKWPNLTLKSGLTNQSTLLQWVLGQGSLSGPQSLSVVFTTANGQPLRTFGFANAVPVRWTGPSANIGANAVATESLEIAHHGLSPSS
jgi:phage tail-like protein